MNTSRKRLLRKNNLSCGGFQGQGQGNRTLRTLLPSNIVADKEDLYLENMGLKQTINELHQQINKYRVRLASNDDEWTRKIKMLGGYHTSELLGQDMITLRRKNHQLLTAADNLKRQMSQLQQNTRVGHLLQMEKQISSLKEDNEKLKFQLKIICQHSGAETKDVQRGYEFEAISHLAALRIEKLTKKNEQYTRQMTLLRQDNLKLRTKLLEFQAQIDTLNAYKMEKQGESGNKINVLQEDSAGQCKVLKFKLEIAEKKVRSLEKATKNTQRYSSENRQLRNSKNFLTKRTPELQSNLRGRQTILTTPRQLTLQKLESLQINSPSNLPKVRKNPSNVSLDQIINTAQQLFVNLHIRGINFQSFREIINEGIPMNLSQIMTILSDSPFGIQDYSKNLLLARYLSENPTEVTVTWVEFKKPVPSSTFWNNLNKLLKECQNREQQNSHSQMLQARRFAILNEPLIRQITASAKEQQKKQTGQQLSPNEYTVRQLLQALSDLDAENRYQVAIKRVGVIVQPKLS